MTQFILLHIAGGTLALLLGTAMMILPKGKLLHKRIGRLFYAAMLATGFSAIVMAQQKANDFLLLIGIFSLYMAHSGLVSARMRKKAPWHAWVNVAAMGVGAAFMVFHASLVVKIFGGVAILLLQQDVRFYLNPLPGKRILLHIGRMTGAYIATVTAFLVVNFSESGLGLILWLGPTVVGSALITWWSISWKRKMKKAAAR